MKEVEILGAPQMFGLGQGRARLKELGLCPEAPSLLGGGMVLPKPPRLVGCLFVGPDAEDPT